jgi:hypothetical protein
MPLTTMKRRRKSSVWIGVDSSGLSRKESMPMLEGVRAAWSGDGGTLGVDGDVADGITYESFTSMQVLVMVAMTGLLDNRYY